MKLYILKYKTSIGNERAVIITVARGDLSLMG